MNLEQIKEKFTRKTTKQMKSKKIVYLHTH